VVRGAGWSLKDGSLLLADLRPIYSRDVELYWIDEVETLVARRLERVYRNNAGE
jgi:hypothetical protein